MLKELSELSSSEFEVLVKAPMLVCILIAGADDKIDNREIKGAIDLARKGKAKPSVAEFYRTAVEDFEDKFKITLESLPRESVSRNAQISEELSHLNKIFPKIEVTFARDFYDSLLYIAKKIANSSGGIFGMKKVGEEELKWLGLPMITAPTIK